ncbi:hypothetical protein F4810DRAFT_684170 [Camillea tinctor]|nr:hypothetical protein F4810DRAFT_684170 [Camillea tinctor]
MPGSTKKMEKAEKPATEKAKPDFMPETYTGQVITRRYINPSKLEDFLEEQFGGEYRVTLRNNVFTVYASRCLTEEELNSLA